MPQRVGNAEFARLCELYRHGVLDTEAEPAIDHAVEVLAARLDVPVARLVLADADRFWTMSGVGAVEPTATRGRGFLEDLVTQGLPFMAAVDKPEAMPPGSPPLRGIAGIRLLSVEGEVLGALYVADTRPRDLAVAAMEPLAEAAVAIRTLFDSRRRLRNDDSTGALNRDAFRDQMRRLIAVSRLGRQSISLVTFDLSAFHATLEAKGPGLTSLSMRLMADIGRTQVRRRDTFGRLAPDLFAILLTDTGEAGAQVLARRLDRHLERGWGTAGLHLAGPVIGIASLKPSSLGECGEGLLARATATPWDPAETRPMARVA